jgi:hypothetical protein
MLKLNLLRDPLATRDVLPVDRFSAGRKLPVTGGVGHARKIGADHEQLRQQLCNK